MTLKYTLKGLISAPMSYFYGSKTMKEAETTYLIIEDKENIIETIDPDIVVLEADQSLKHIEIPHCMGFTEVMLKIAKFPCIKCVNISGHNKIQMDVKTIKTLETFAGMQIMYQIPVPTDSKYTHLALKVDVDQLLEAIRVLEKEQVQILFLHDY